MATMTTMMQQNVTMKFANASASASASGSGGGSGQLTYQDELLIINIKIIVFGWLILFVGVIGIVLNSFTIVVLMHPKMRQFSTNVYLTALSAANIICLLSYIVLYALRYLVSADNFRQAIKLKSTMGQSQMAASNGLTMHPYESFINFSIRFISPLFTTFQLYAIYLTCAVTIDRWIYLTWPLKADKICTMRNTLAAIFGIFTFCVLYNSPKWFEVSCDRVTNPVTNQTYYQAYSTDFARNYFIMVINRYGYLIFIYGIPFLILLIVNIGIIIKLIETKKRKSHLLGKPTTKYAAATSRTTSSNNLKDVCKQVSVEPMNNASSATNGGGNHGNSDSAVAGEVSATNTRAKSKQRSEGGGPFRPSLSSSIASTLKLDPKITLMILAVVMAFFCCQFPYLIIHMLHSSHSREKWFAVFKTFCDFLASLNCCINFLIYCLFGRNFRQIAKTILCNPSLSPYNQQLLHKQATTRRSGAGAGASSVLEKSRTQIYREKKSRVDLPLQHQVALNETPLSRPAKQLMDEETAEMSQSLLQEPSAANNC